MQHEPTKSRPRAWRARWAAVGAAVAVMVGGGGLFVANAAQSGPGSTFVPIEPARVLDTRVQPCSDGSFGSGLFADQLGFTFNVVGSADPCNLEPDAVPAGATAVVLNVTVVRPTGAGFVSVRPWKSYDFVLPTISQLNFEAGEVAPNAVTVALPVDGEQAGAIELYYGSRCQCPKEELPLPSPHYTEILIDVMGYYVGSAPMVVPE